MASSVHARPRCCRFRLSATQHLDVAMRPRMVKWNPEHGYIEIPARWKLYPLASSYPAVKLRGHWLSWQPRSEPPAVGVSTLGAEQVHRRSPGARRGDGRCWRPGVPAQARQRQEDRYRHELEDAIVRFLAFVPAHQGLEQRIAKETAARAAVVGSRRVGRNRKLTVDDSGCHLSVRAYIRHGFTSYHDDLDALSPEHWDEQYWYREIRGAANESGRPLPLRASLQ